MEQRGEGVSPDKTEKTCRPRVASSILALVWALGPGCGSTPPEADLIIRDATVIDGTGAPAHRADVAIRGKRIHRIGDLGSMRATREVEAHGLTLTPGFVDIHSHADLILLGEPEARQRLLGAKISQGVTTLIVGNCGLGAAPSSEPAAEVLSKVNGWMTPDEVAVGALSVAGYLDRLEASGVPLNVGTLVPHGPVRISAMGLSPGAPSPDQLENMKAAVARGLDDGAFGLSTGLIYPPGMYAATDELVALAREVAARDRIFTCHVRGSSETLLRATEELIEIARKSGARVHHSHLEAVGARFWADVAGVLALEDEARESGVAVSHDVFPYTRAATMMAAIFPPWALDGGIPALLERLREPATRARVRSEIESRVPDWPPWRPNGWPHNLVEAVGWDGIRVASVPSGGPLHFVGRDLASIALASQRDPFDVVADLMISEDGQVGQQVDEISGRDDEIETLLSILRHESAAVISDAEDYGRGSPHPAHAGAFARVFRLARERSLFPLEEAVRKMSSYPASLLRIEDRGILREGGFADLVLLDPVRVLDRATWEAPRQAAEGISLVVVNGKIVARDGRFLGGLPGHVLRAGRPADRTRAR